MKAHWKVIMTAVLAGALALLLSLGASIGTAAAPDPQLTNDIVFVGNGKGTAGVGNTVKIVDVDAMAVVNTIGGGGLLANNHGVVLDGTTLWNANAALSNYKSVAVKLDLATMDQYAYPVSANAGGAFTTGFCGIEKAPANGGIWATNMSGTADVGGIYDVETGAYVDTSEGTDNAATCGINWNSGGTVAYSSLMNAKKFNQMAWPGGPITASTGAVTGTGLLHISDIAKTAQYGYVTGGNVAGQGKLVVVDLTSMTVVNIMDTSNPGDPHGPTVAHNEGFLYLHSRTPGGSDTSGQLQIFDIGGGSAGGTKVNPVLIGSINDEGTPGVSCGTEVGSKDVLCGAPDVSMDKNNVYWASFDEFQNRILSVDFNVYNHNALAALNMAVTDTVNTNGVTTSSIIGGGTVDGNGSILVTVKYNVARNVKSFQTTVNYTANNLCNQSGNFPGYQTGISVPKW